MPIGDDSPKRNELVDLHYRNLERVKKEHSGQIDNQDQYNKYDVSIQIHQGVYLQPEQLLRQLRGECYLSFGWLLKDEMTTMDRKDSFIFSSQAKGFELSEENPDRKKAPKSKL